MLENDNEEMIGALAATIIYAKEHLQIASNSTVYDDDSLNVWVLNKRIN
jgi:pyruvate carboxylase subunit A/acetyl-CoA carboxylase biotin carboxylase subunit